MNTKQAETIKATQLGKDAQKSGNPPYPMFNKEIASMMQGRKVGEGTHILYGFNRGWTLALLA